MVEAKTVAVTPSIIDCKTKYMVSVSPLSRAPAIDSACAKAGLAVTKLVNRLSPLPRDRRNGSQPVTKRASRSSIFSGSPDPLTMLGSAQDILSSEPRTTDQDHRKADPLRDTPASPETRLLKLQQG